MVAAIIVSGQRQRLCFTSFLFICCPPYLVTSEIPFVPCSQPKSEIGLAHLINTQTHLDNFCTTLTQLKSFYNNTKKINNNGRFK